MVDPKEAKALRQIVESDWWEWMPGILVDVRGTRWRLLSTRSYDDGQLWLNFPGMTMEVGPDCQPVLSDAATQGCLLRMFSRIDGNEWSPTASGVLAYVSACCQLEEWRNAT